MVLFVCFSDAAVVLDSYQWHSTSPLCKETRRKEGGEERDGGKTREKYNICCYFNVTVSQFCPQPGFQLEVSLSTTDTDDIFYMTKKLQHQRKHTLWLSLCYLMRRYNSRAFVVLQGVTETRDCYLLACNRWKTWVRRQCMRVCVPVTWEWGGQDQKHFVIRLHQTYSHMYTRSSAPWNFQLNSTCWRRDHCREQRLTMEVWQGDMLCMSSLHMPVRTCVCVWLHGVLQEDSVGG